MSEDNEAKHLCTTEDEFDKFQSVSMYQEEEFITLSDIVSPQPEIPDYIDMSQIPSDSEVVLTNDTPQDNNINEEANLLKPIHYETHTLVSNSPVKSESTTEIQQPKKRGRKKKIIPTTPVDNNISSHSQTHDSDSSILESKSFVATKRGRMVKRPIHYNINTLEKQKRGRPKKSSLSDNLLLSAADSTTVDNTSDNIINNSDIPKIEETMPISIDTPKPKKRGRPKKNVSQSDNLSQPLVTNAGASLIDGNMNNFVSGNTSSMIDKKSNNELLVDAKLSNNEKTKTSSLEISVNDDIENISLSQLKKVPERLSNEDLLAIDSHVSDGNDEEKNIATCQNTPSVSPKIKTSKRARKSHKEIGSSVVSSVEVNSHNIKMSDEEDETDNLCLSKLKKSLDVDTPSVDNADVKNDTLEQAVSNFNMQGKDAEDTILSKRNTKMPIMSDFEYNIDSIVAGNTNTGENDADEDQSKRCRKAKQLPHNYHEESDEDPFANVELSDEEPQKRRKGHKYNSDDEYIPGYHSNSKRRKGSVDSSDSDLIDDKIDKMNESRRKKRKAIIKSDNDSPFKKGEVINKRNDCRQIDDIEEVLQSSVITASTPSWSAINEVENFLAKKIQGTNLKIKKVSESTEQKAPLEIPVLIPDKKKMIEMCSQTDKIKTSSVGLQTSTCNDIPMKENVTLSKEQSENACQFLNSIVKTTAELGQLMTQKSEDFIKKKIHTQNITDTFKMDYCVKKSFLLFKLAKHNLMQMEEDLSKQYEDFLQNNGLSSCREEEKAIIANPKPDNDSDCEIVEVPVSSNKSKTMKFNPKTVFLNKELSIKIAKKASDQTPQPAQAAQKNLNIKGRHSVWINDTVMVKKVKPTQSFLAQDSRNKKPPDTFVTEKMVSDFFTEYKRLQANTICAPFVSHDWILFNTECICNYFVAQSTKLSPSAGFSTNEPIPVDNTSRFDVPENNHIENIKSVPNIEIAPESLFTLCFRLLNKMYNESSCIIKHEGNDETRNKTQQPKSLSQLCLGTLFYTDCESPTLPEVDTDTIECVSYGYSLTILPLKTICYKRILELYTDTKMSVPTQSEAFTDQCNRNEYFLEELGSEDTPIERTSVVQEFHTDCLKNEKVFDEIRSDSEGTELKRFFSAVDTEIIAASSCNEVRTLLSLCVKSIQKCYVENYLENDSYNSEMRVSVKDMAPSALILTKNEVVPLITLCVRNIQRLLLCKDVIQSCKPKTLNYMALEKVKQVLYTDLTNSQSNSQSQIGNMSPCINNQPIGIDVPITSVTINSINTLSEEAFLTLENIHTNVINEAEYGDDFDDTTCDQYHEDNESEFDASQDNKLNWVSQVQIKELNPCFNNSIILESEKECEPVIASIKIEPIESHFDSTSESIFAMPTVDNTITVKSENGPGLDEMTMIPDISHIKSEVDNINEIGIQRLNSNSYDCETFEQFVRSNKMMAATNYNESDIFSQSALRVRRQHEPDLDGENDMDMSLLIPQTYETMNIDTAKGTLMETSSDEASKGKKNPGKKKTERKSRTKSKKPDPKIPPNKDTSSSSKEKKVTTEVAVLTRRMREKIRQEEKNGNSSDSENETLYSLAKVDKSKTSGKVTETEIQCNNVDSTANVVDEHDDVPEKFPGFSTIDQSETTSYQKFMKYVYDKIIPENESKQRSKLEKSTDNDSVVKESVSSLFKANEPVELLECEPTMPIFDDDSRTVTAVGKRKLKKNLVKSDTNENIQSQTQEPKQPASIDTNVQFVERHGWKCYPLNTNDTKLYQSPCLILEKLPESFVATYFRYRNITSSKSKDDDEVDRLTNLNTLNRNTQLKEPAVRERRVKIDGKVQRTSEPDRETESRSASPANSEGGAELTPSEDEGGNIEDQSTQLGPKQTENILAKDLLMNDSDNDGEEKVKVKTEPPEAAASAVKTYKPGPKSKTRGAGKNFELPDAGSLMLTADKMMNKELTFLHAPVVMNEGEVNNPPLKKLIPRACKKPSTRNQLEKSNLLDQDDSSSEEEKQWVSTKEKLLKRMGKKEDAVVDDAKRTKLVIDFIERRADMPDSRKRSRGRVVRARKKFLERQKQLKVLSRELFGEPATDGTHKRSAQVNFKGRRNIRQVIDKKSLARSTVLANMEEFERKKRLNARQARLREVLGCEEGVNVLVINDEVCLEYDFEEHRPVVTVHPFFTKVMKAHQYEGVKFMWDACFESLSVVESGHQGGGCILAHCMGLGKTLQVLALLHTVLTHPRVGMRRILVCCPLSTVLNWVDEIHKWIGPVTNQIKVFELSKLKKTYERAYQLEDWYNGGGIFIIGYELFRSLSTLDPFIDNIRPTIVNKIRTALLDPGPDIIVCDEGHLLKNDCSVLAVAMSRVVTKRRIVLTGTPMQNNLREYYCMVDFVKPNLLGTYSEYSNRFENPIMNGQHRDSSAEDIKLMKARTHILHKVLEGCLQRQEASVLYPYLPKKHEYTVFIPLTKCQWDLYKHYMNNYAKQSKQSILKDFHILHKIWSHPQVLHNFQTKARDDRAKIKAEKLEDDLATEDQEEIKPNETDIWWLEYLDGGKMLESLEASNKFVAVFQILEECIALGDKMLIFSTSLFCLDSLEYFLKRIKKWSLGQEYFRLDGSVPPEVRQKWCREFNADNNVKTKLFLVSTRAGCLGLNMTAANRVVIMDTSWNPAHDIQSIFRVYRFGQKKDCFIYRLVAMGSMEQKIYERSVTKQAVACRVVDEQQIDRHYNSAELTELYMYDESGASVAGGVAVGVQDVVLLRVARVAALHAVHEHDSLLRGSEPALPEHERVAAWLQFQQEQEDKQIQNSLGVYLPKIKIPLKRIYGPESAKVNTVVKTENVKQEESETPNVATPTETKPKRRKKNLVVNCRIPVQEEVVNNEESMPTLQHILRSSDTPVQDVPPEPTPKAKKSRGRPRKSDLTQAGTSQIVPTEVSITNDEDALVEKITDVLLRHDIQNKRLEVGKLIANVKSVVSKGEQDNNDQPDDLARSIAKILLEQSSSRLQPSAVTDIVCESITNSVVANTSQEVEEITGDIPSTPVETEPRKYKPKPKRFKDKDSVDHKDNKSRDVLVTAYVTSVAENRTQRRAAVDAKKSIDSMAQDVVINLDDDDDGADVDFMPADDSDYEFTPNKPHTQATETAAKPKKKTVSKPETVVKNYAPIVVTAGNVATITKCLIKEKIQRKEVSERLSQMPTKEKDKDMTSIVLSDEDEPPVRSNVPEKSTEAINEEVALPLSLLTNKNFIKIVAHTYLAGNPMLDEDAATLAAQYSTYRALKEAELSGKPIQSGPIYDIALKILGPSIMKKLHIVHDKRLTESNATVQQLQDNIQAIQAHLQPETSTSTPDSGPKRHIRTFLKPIAPPSTVVPVGLITRAAPTTSSFTPQATVTLEECILPDDDECIISESNVTPTQQTRNIAPIPTTSTNTPILEGPRIILGKPAVPTAVAKSARPITVPHPRNVIKICKGRVILPRDPAHVDGNTDTSGNTICLDSDDEDAPLVVPVSLTAARSGISLPLPNVQPVGLSPAENPAQVLRVSTPRTTRRVEVFTTDLVRVPVLEVGPSSLKPVPIAPKPPPLPPALIPAKPVIQVEAPVKPLAVTKSRESKPESQTIKQPQKSCASEKSASESRPSESQICTTIASTDSSSDSSRPSSPDNPLSILKDVVHIQAADDQPRKSRMKTATIDNSGRQNVAVQHIVASDAKSNFKTITAKSNRSVIDMSHSASTSTMTTPKESKAKLHPITSAHSKPNVQTYTITAKDLEKAKAAKGPIKIVGTTKNIILDGSKGLKLSSKTAVYTHTTKKPVIKVLATNKPTKPATDKKRMSSAADSGLAKKSKKEPMTLKDFDIDDIDDIIELE